MSYRCLTRYVMMSLTNTADGSSLCNTLFYRRKLTIRRRIIKAKEKADTSYGVSASLSYLSTIDCYQQCND